MREAAGQSSEVMGGATAQPPGSTIDTERILLLECRLESLRSALGEARAESDRLRGRLAEVAAREADHARRYSLIHQELAEARSDIVSLHDHLNRSEALRARLEGHLFEPGPGTDAAELLRLRRELSRERQRADVHEQTAARLRSRVDELLMSRDALLTRVAEWHRLVQTGNPEAIDLGEFIAELRQDILTLENRNALNERQEIALRELLAGAGVDPDAQAATAAPDLTDQAAAPQAATARVAESPEVERATPAALTFEGFLNSAHEPDLALETLWEAEPQVVEQSDRAAGPETAAKPWFWLDEALESAHLPQADTALESVLVPEEEDSRPAFEPSAPESEPVLQPVPVSVAAQPETLEVPAMTARAPAETAFAPTRAGLDGLNDADPMVRAAWYGRLTHELEGSPARLTDHLRSGLADADPRVRRRAVLAAATARNLALRPLLEPLRSDPDPHVRRVVREVLRHAPAAELQPHDSTELT